MRKYQICKRGGVEALAISWERIPESLVCSILPEYIYNVFYLKEGNLDIKSVIYFRPVKKFNKDIIPFTVGEDIEFGV